MQAEKKPTSLKYFMQAKSVDVANANSYRIDMMWEILTPDVRSKQVAVRISSRLFWLGQPPNFVTKSLIERQYKSNVAEMLTFYRKWAPDMIEMSNIRKIEDNIKNIIKPHHKIEDH